MCACGVLGGLRFTVSEACARACRAFLRAVMQSGLAADMLRVWCFACIERSRSLGGCIKGKGCEFACLASPWIFAHGCARTHTSHDYGMQTR